METNFLQFLEKSDPLPHPSEYSLQEAYNDGATAHAAMERNHGGGFNHPALVRAWTAGWEQSEIDDSD